MAEYYVALYDYTATADNGLSLRRGETIIVREKGSTGWWSGESSSGAIGWFPESYVTKQETVPAGWQAIQDDQGRTYYLNTYTQETTWTLPTSAASGGSAPTPSKSQTVSPSTSSNDFSQIQPPSQDEFKGFAKDVRGRITYSDNFWSDTKDNLSGFDILILKHRNGKEVMKDMSEWMRELAAIEDRYAKDLVRLGKSTLADIEEGTMRTAWKQVKFDLESQSRARSAFSSDLLGKVEKQLMEFKDEQKKKRKDFEEIIAKDRKNITAKAGDVWKAKKLYDQRTKEADESEALLNSGDQSKSKFEEKAKKDRKLATQAALDYKKIVEEYHELRKEWEDHMSLACLDLNEEEEKRVDHLKKTLEAYLDASNEVRLKLNQSADMVRDSIKAVSSEIDIELFVKTKATGQRKPPNLQFEQYVSVKK